MKIQLLIARLATGLWKHRPNHQDTLERKSPAIAPSSHEQRNSPIARQVKAGLCFPHVTRTQRSNRDTANTPSHSSSRSYAMAMGRDDLYKLCLIQSLTQPQSCATAPAGPFFHTYQLRSFSLLSPGTAKTNISISNPSYSRRTELP